MVLQDPFSRTSYCAIYLRLRIGQDCHWSISFHNPRGGWIIRCKRQKVKQKVTIICNVTKRVCGYYGCTPEARDKIGCHQPRLVYHIVPLDMKGCICYFVKWQIHPFISKRTIIVCCWSIHPRLVEVVHLLPEREVKPPEDSHPTRESRLDCSTKLRNTAVTLLVEISISTNGVTTVFSGLSGPPHSQTICPEGGGVLYLRRHCLIARKLRPFYIQYPVDLSRTQPSPVCWLAAESARATYHH